MRGEDAEAGEKGDAGGRSREGDVAGGKTLQGEDAEAGKGDAEGSEQGRRRGREKEKRRLHTAAERNLRQGSSAPQGDAGSAI